MAWLITTSLRFRVLIMALSAFLLVYGFWTLQSTPLDVFPEFASPRVEVQVEAPGLSTEEVESLITLPIEQALNGLPWMETIRSKTV
ncbi:MAG: efflux RND transporter permease subunit, partial [Nitrospirales bacterium]|nr:efflux RND transporter permease subunit [Nitrospirales bacterium]